MSSAPSTVARLRTPRWRDPRLVVGLLLLLTSVVAGARVVAAADASTPVWAAATDLGPQTVLREGDLTVRNVRLDAGLDRYVSAAGSKPVGLTLTRAVGAGELLPQAALAPAGGRDLRRVSVEVSTAAALQRGSVVEIYSVPDAAGGGAADKPAARRIVDEVTIADVGDSGRMLGSNSRRSVTLLLDSAEVQPVLDAVASGGVELVQVGAGAAALPGDRRVP